MSVSVYYEDDWVTLWHGDCRQIDAWQEAETVVTDPPYPNNAGWFDDAILAAMDTLRFVRASQAIVFWHELSHPPVPLPLVAVHIWHRTNVNGRPYEPAYHFAANAAKRRSDVIRHAAVFGGVGPGCWEYVGHPTQKPVSVMRQLIERTTGTVADPFAGAGSTLVAAKLAGRKAVGAEINERYCEMAARRLAQDVLDFGVA